MATLALRLRGLQVHTFASAAEPNKNAGLIEEIGAHYHSVKELPFAGSSAQFGAYDIIFEATGYAPLAFEAMGELNKNGVLVLSSVTGGKHTIEIDADKINLEFVLGNKVMVGTVNAGREHFEMRRQRLRAGAAHLAGLAAKAAHAPGAGPRKLRTAHRDAHHRRGRDQSVLRGVVMTYDVVIVGSGAGGSTLAHRARPDRCEHPDLRARRLPARAAKTTGTSPRSSSTRAYTTQEHWLDKHGNPFRPGNHYYVGGNTKFYGAALLRFRESDFKETAHAGGVSPAWPIGYADLEPYYTRAEHLYHVHGEHGVDPTEPPASAAVRLSARLARTARRGVGRRSEQARPASVRVCRWESCSTSATAEASACIRCETCDGFPCLVDAKADAHVVALRPALQHANVSLTTNAFVKRLETSASGREVTDVVYERDGRRGTGVAVTSWSFSSGAVNSAALLLRSANEHHPNGLANGSGVVGRHYMAHNNSAMVALSKRPNPTVFQKTLGVNDYYYGDADFAHPMGHVQMLGKSQADMFRGDAKFAPEAVLQQMATHALDFWFTSEDLPDPENRVTLERDGTIRLSYTENNLEGHNRLVQTFKNNLEGLGCESHHWLPNAVYLRKKIPVAGVAHQNGTVRFGHDPATSALDVELQGARARQPLRRRRQLLRLEHRGESGAHDHGECAARRRRHRRAACGLIAGTGGSVQRKIQGAPPV